MTEFPQQNSYEANSLIQQQYDVLQVRPDTVEMSLKDVEVANARLDRVVPLAVEGNAALLAGVRVGPDKRMQIWGSINSEGRIDENSVFLTDEGFDPKKDPSDPKKFIAIKAGEPERTIGRSPTDAQTISSMPDSVSRRHFSISLDNEGLLNVRDLGSLNGTELLAKKVPQEQTETQVVHVQEGEHPLANPHPRSEDRFKDVEQDPGFASIVSPYRQQINALSAQFNAARIPLEAEIKRLHHVDEMQMYEAEHQLKVLSEDFGKATETLRSGMEEAVKPYLSERLGFFRGDTLAGYARPGQLNVENCKLMTIDGKKIGHYVPGMKQYVVTNIFNGQITVPPRLTSWAGSSGGKKNHQTGRTTSSSSHIVDLAAAMVSGSWKDEHEPVVIKRSHQADYELPRELQGKVPLYAVKLGMHRIAARRLIEGLNAPVSYDEIEE